MNRSGQTIRTITLDLDDTLWEIGPVIRRAEATLQRWLAENYPRVVELFPEPEIVELRQQIIGEHEGMLHDLTFIRKAVLTAMFTRADYALDAVDAAFSIFSAARNDVRLYPDVLPALESLRRCHTLVAVTNGNADLEQIGLSEYFAAVVTARDAGAAKPARRIFDAAVSAGGAPAEQTLHIGDHPEIDVVGARAAGLRSVWLNRNGEAWPIAAEGPDLEVKTLGELDALLAGRRA